MVFGNNTANNMRELLPGAGSQISEDFIFLSLIRLFCEFTLIQSALTTPFVRSFNLTNFLQQCVIHSTDIEQFAVSHTSSIVNNWLQYIVCSLNSKHTMAMFEDYTF